MNEDILRGKWNQLRGEIQKQWGMLTDDDMDVVEGEYEKLVGRIQERYGWERARAEREVESFLRQYETY